VATRLLHPKPELVQFTFCRQRNTLSINNAPATWSVHFLPETQARQNQFFQGRSAYLNPTLEALSAALKRKALQKALKRPMGGDILKSLQHVLQGTDHA